MKKSPFLPLPTPSKHDPFSTACLIHNENVIIFIAFEVPHLQPALGCSKFRFAVMDLYRQACLNAKNVSLAALPTIYAITPTYSRPVQKAELTRLANTFRQVSRLHWILVEDAAARSELVSRFVAGAGLPCTHLHVPTPRRYKRPGLPRATEQRNAGLAWLRQRHQHLPPPQPGVLFFADDDNTYSLELFQEMRTTRKVSVWPVGLVGGRRYERPVVENGKVVGWYTGWRADRPFAIDMAGFAVSLQVILSHPKAVFKRRGSQPGMQESDFLKQITTVEELEPKANNCTKVLVWHTRTEKVNLANEPKYHLDTVNIEV
ncbi:galactosylgalactosylxylosylprotein 3-beta-glucuronosyltransferase 2 [Patagioenas fasciata monilis]|uniref:Galactosylgalactosylxylosylprotein 3-beta-glucuronosyltransferase n=2 Tax=Columbidae TaxID=8930 RepID=A0A1V4JMH4_PATFA|nr:galactosylgalactosylxylosylprotein 3-beta-glucuronosyltransferase 2 [Patagioenas fasciata monilis]